MTAQPVPLTRRITRASGAALSRVVRVLMIVGSSLNGSRSGDQQARALYERRDRDHAPERDHLIDRAS
jgi:hypothetical protein